jgi:AraC-like DNA-binding protein
VAAELVAGRAASSDVVSRLCELLLVEAVRSYAASLDQHQRGWLKGMSDPHIGRALASLHGAVSSPWSVEQLAREAALSRSTFVERFTSVTGMPPIRYLIYWRLQAAQRDGRLLRSHIVWATTRRRRLAALSSESWEFLLHGGEKLGTRCPGQAFARFEHYSAQAPDHQLASPPLARSGSAGLTPGPLGIIRVVLVVGLLLPVYPDNRTILEPVQTSHLGPEPAIARACGAAKLARPDFLSSTRSEV